MSAATVEEPVLAAVEAPAPSSAETLKREQMLQEEYGSVRGPCCDLRQWVRRDLFAYFLCPVMHYSQYVLLFLVMFFRLIGSVFSSIPPYHIPTNPVAWQTLHARGPPLFPQIVRPAIGPVFWLPLLLPATEDRVFGIHGFVV